MNPQITRKIMNLFARIDNQISNLIWHTGLRCPDYCGRCCYNKRVDISPLELYPLVSFFIHTGALEIWLEKLYNPDTGVTCIFHQSDPLNPDKGRCLVYSFRPCVCRLFGFSGRIADTGEHIMLPCKVQSKEYPEAVQMARHFVQGQKKIPLLTGYKQRLMHLDPELGNKYMPMNQAIKFVLEKAAIIQKYSTVE